MIGALTGMRGRRSTGPSRLRVNRSACASGGAACCATTRIKTGRDGSGPPQKAGPTTERARKKSENGLAEVAPVVEFVGVFGPAVAYVGAVVHVGDEDVFDAGIDLGLGLFHGLAGADYGEDYAGCAGD